MTPGPMDVGPVRRQAGFTILELVLSLGLLALITASIAGGLHVAVRTFESGRLQQDGEELDAVARVFPGLIGAAIPAVAIDDQNVVRLVFQGRPDSLTFVTLGAGDTLEGGLVQSMIGRWSDDRGRQVVALWSSVFRSRDAWSVEAANMRRVVIAPNVKQLRFAYFGIVDAARGPEWRSDWIARDRMPTLVSLFIQFERSNGRFELPIVVALRPS